MKGFKNIINKKCIKYAKQADIFDAIEINSFSNCVITLKGQIEK